MGRGQARTNNRGRTRGGSTTRGGGRGTIRGRGGKRGSQNGRVNGKVDTKLDRWKTAEDVPMDEEDEFFAARDKILLDDTARARARAGPGMGDEDEFDEDDEVFGLDGVGDLSSDEDEDDDEEEDGSDEESENEAPAPTKPKSNAKRAAKDDHSDTSSDSEEELSRWGKSRSTYYADNSRVMDEDDTEARETEEREGRRLQAKLVAEIGEDDWGYNDVHDIDEGVDSLSAVPVAAPLPTDKASLLRHMEKHDPLALALAQDWEDTAYQVMETTTAVKQLGATNPNDPALGLMHLHHQTLLSYAATLAFYLHLRSAPSTNDSSDVSPPPSPPTPAESKRIRTEIISRLLTLKQSLATLEDLGFAADEEDEEDEEDEDNDFNDSEDDFSVNGDESFQINGGGASEGSDDDNLEQDWQQEKIAGWVVSSEDKGKGKKKKKQKQKDSELGELEEGELEALMEDALELEEPTPSSPKKRSRKADVVMEEDQPKEKKKKKKATVPEGPAFDLVEPEFTSTKKGKRASTSTNDESEAFGDPTQLSHTDASDKEGRRRTLRFHTSKIESASSRRSAARAGMGGDDDLPYRTRQKEQKRKGLGEGGDDLEMDVDTNGDVGMDTDSASMGKRTRDSASPMGDEEAEGEDGYYDLVRKAKKQKKEEKKAEYDAIRAAERIDPDEASSSGPRSLTRAILKNRGMTPNRSPKNKAARNPRVKKKMQYAKAQKKLGSRQAVFKGGAEVAAAREGRYEGEKSGISGRVVKSVKL
ncbi:Something about silencing protein 10 [Ceratobasidium sp. AG-Ba]|nr:Something about silencing protein 10 [Ceratobasidium sp. AG-Ba]